MDVVIDGANKMIQGLESLSKSFGTIFAIIVVLSLASSIAWFIANRMSNR